jgi:hypothetical protein
MKALLCGALLYFVLADAADAAERLSPAVQAELTRAEEVGRALHGQVLAGEIANEVLLREGILKPGMKAAEKPFEARVSVELADGWQVRFLSRDGERVVANFDVLLQRLAQKGATMVIHPAPVEVDKNARRKFFARGLAPRIVTEPCAGTYIVAVLPHVDLGGSGWTVYALTGEKEDEIALGGHYRAEVSLDGTELQGAKRLSKGCLTLRKRDLGGGAAKLAGFYAVERVADYPTEIHVYLSLKHGLDAYVETRNGKWRVSKGRIAPADAPR